MMPGGSAEAYKHIQAIVEKVAAQVRCHSCWHFHALAAVM